MCARACSVFNRTQFCQGCITDCSSGWFLTGLHGEVDPFLLKMHEVDIAGAQAPPPTPPCDPIAVLFGALTRENLAEPNCRGPERARHRASNSIGTSEGEDQPLVGTAQIWLCFGLASWVIADFVCTPRDRIAGENLLSRSGMVQNVTSVPAVVLRFGLTKLALPNGFKIG